MVRTDELSRFKEAFIVSDALGIVFVSGIDLAGVSYSFATDSSSFLQEKLQKAIVNVIRPENPN